LNNLNRYSTENVDHGKTSLLDYIRGSAVAKGEAGGITQHIGATEVPISSIKKICGELIKKWKMNIKIPGLLVIDTPGHEAFTLLRKRGGSLADIAILIVDVTEGVKPQTEESINILRQNNTPFVVAANKIDKISGWVSYKNECFLDSFSKQNQNIQEELDKKIYELIGQLYKANFKAERYDRIEDFKKQVAIVPISALSGEGVPDLLTALTGVTQKYLEKKLEIDTKGRGKGTILEVKEVKGLGKTIDVILYDGIMRKGDYLIIGNPGNVIETKIKSLLKISPLREIRVEKQFIPVKEIGAAAGIKISALNLENVMAGVPVISVRNKDEISKARKEVRKEIESIEMKTEKEGVIIRADTLGSLEAIIKTFNEMNVPIRKARIGSVNKKDVSELEEIDDRYKVIFAFNTHVLPEAEELSKKRKISIIENNVIYRLSEDYEKYLKRLEEEKKRDVLEKVTLPAKIKIMRKFIFRKSKPAIVGVEVKGGTIREGVKLMKENGEGIGEVKAVQDKAVNIREASIGMEVAVSIDKATVGRNVDPEEILFTFLTKEDYQLLKKNIDLLTDNEKNVLEEIQEIMVKKEKYWDVV
jgi:translation initiation factor 5B